MQFSPQVLLGWSAMLGWVLILAGLVISTLALSNRPIPRLRFAPAKGRRRRPLAYVLARPVARLDAAAQWSRLATIVGESHEGILAAAAVDQVRAAEAVEAADEALTEMLADLAAVRLAPTPTALLELPQVAAAPARPARPAAQPLAA